MNVIDAIQQRRSIKAYHDTQGLPEKDFQQLISAAIQAPTSFNIQHWRFVRVQDSVKRQQLRQLAWGQAQVTDAAELVIICADTKAWQKEPQRYWRNANAETSAVLVESLTGFYRDRDWLQRDEAIRSGAMAAQTMMLAATELGYTTSPMIGFDIDAAGKAIQLPDDHVIVMMIAIGHGTGEAKPRGGQLTLDEVLVTDQFG